MAAGLDKSLDDPTCEPWPANRVALVRDALPPAALAAVAADAGALAACEENWWVPRARVEAGPGAARTPFELAACLLYERHVRRRLLPLPLLQAPQDEGGWAGVEVWCQVYAPGRGLPFHFDKDEALLRAGGPMAHPAWSSILYLTGEDGGGGDGSSSGDENVAGAAAEAAAAAAGGGGPGDAAAAGGDAWDGARQGATVVLQQRFDAAAGRPEPPAPRRSVLMWPLRGAYALFDGRLGHGVLESCSGTRRATLLLNWWAGHQPRGVEELPDAEVAARGLTRLEAGDAARLLATGGGGGGSGDDDDGGGDGGGGLAAALQSGCSVADAAGAADGQAQPRQQRLPVCDVAATAAAVAAASGDSDNDDGGGGGGGEVLLVDDVVAAAGLRLAGAGAVSAVVFRHGADHQLFPIEPPEGSVGGGGGGGEEGEDAGERLQTLAAFVRGDVMQDDEDDEDEECSSEDENGR